jgi:hypothetical protein
VVDVLPRPPKCSSRGLSSRRPLSDQMSSGERIMPKFRPSGVRSSGINSSTPIRTGSNHVSSIDWAIRLPLPSKLAAPMRSSNL